MHVFVTHSGTELAELRKEEGVGCKAGYIVFAYSSLRSRDVNACYGIVVGTAGEGFLSPCLHLALPYRVGQNCLGCIHPPRIVSGAMYGGIVCHTAGLGGNRLGTVTGAVIVQVHVNAELAADKTVIVKVGSQSVRSPVTNDTPGISSEFVHHRTILEDISVDQRVHIVSQIPAPFDLSSDGMVVGYLPVHTGIAIYHIAYVFNEDVSPVFEQPVLTRCSLAEGFLIDSIALLAGSIAVIIDSGEYIHSTCTVIHVDSAGRVISLRPSQRLIIRCSDIEAETIALSPDGPDTDHRLHGSIILGTRIGDYLDALDLIAPEALQLGTVSNPASVDIHHRCSFPDHFQTVASFDDPRRLGQHITSCTDVLQH